ncbi:MAG: hypothetical protein WAU00_19900 [Caldilinea sp.]|nr:hypothetical protein [Anaerolineales bacterium]
MGTFTPSIDLDGKITINHRADAQLIHILNTPGAFEGEVAQPSCISTRSVEMVASGQPLFTLDHSSNANLVRPGATARGENFHL